MKLRRSTIGRIVFRAAAPYVSVLCLVSFIFPAAAQTAKPAPAAPPPVSTTSPVPLDDSAPYADDSEVKLGRENAQENDKHVKLITDPKSLERVNRIGQSLAAVANTVPIPAHWGSSQLKRFHYTFKIVDDKDVNAYSLPGGFIYVNKGLLDLVRSDDELAGVLAHEVSHAMHHHMIKLLHEQNKLDKFLQPLAILALGAMVGSGGRSAADLSNLMYATQLYATARLNGYGVEAEKDADASGMYLMTHTTYNPVGMYSFMLRLAALERTHSYGDLGIFRTHPPGEERVEAARQMLNQMNIPIHLSEVDPTLQIAVTVPKPQSGEREIAEIKMRDILLCRVVAANGISAEQRAEQIGQRMNRLLDTQLQPFEVRVNREQTAVIVRGQVMLNTFDAAAQKMTMADMARELATAVARVQQKRLLETRS